MDLQPQPCGRDMIQRTGSGASSREQWNTGGLVGCSPEGHRVRHDLATDNSMWKGHNTQDDYWSGLPCPPPGALPDPGVEPGSPALQAEFLLAEPRGTPIADSIG